MKEYIELLAGIRAEMTKSEWSEKRASKFIDLYVEILAEATEFVTTAQVRVEQEHLSIERGIPGFPEYPYVFLDGMVVVYGKNHEASIDFECATSKNPFVSVENPSTNPSTNGYWGLDVLNDLYLAWPAEELFVKIHQTRLEELNRLVKKAAIDALEPFRPKVEEFIVGLCKSGEKKDEVVKLLAIAMNKSGINCADPKILREILAAMACRGDLPNIIDNNPYILAMDDEDLAGVIRAAQLAVVHES